MNTAYNNTTTVQESRNRYNALLAQALERIKARKTDKTVQEPEEVTTTTTDVTPTPTQQPEPVATPEEVTTEPTEASKSEQVTTTRKTTKTASPKPLGRDIYHIFTEKLSKWALLFDKSVYHAPEGCAVLSDNTILVTSKLDYKEEYSGKLIQEDGTESKKDPYLIRKYKDVCQPTESKYTITPKEIEEQIKSIQDERRREGLCDLLEKDFTPEEAKEELKRNEIARKIVNKYAKHQFVELLLPNGGAVVFLDKRIKMALNVAKKLGTTYISYSDNFVEFSGEFGTVVLGRVFGVYTQNDTTINIDLTDATPAPADTTAIEEATPITAPQEAEEDTTTAPEEVATEEDATPASATDDATVFCDAIEQYGNLGAKYLESLDYNQATEQVYSTKRGNSTKVTERYYTMKDGTIYGLYRRYNKNGKRAEFAVYQDGQIIEKRTYGKNKNRYKAEVKYCGGKLCYQVEEGKVTSVEYYEGKRRHYHIEFDDTNRPATPRDLPAPAPTKTAKETTKEAPATTVQKQETSKPAPVATTKTTTTPEEVQEVTTSKQEDDTTPYWLLLDNELRAQQEEQETAPAPEATKQEEPMHAPQMLKKMIEEHYKRIKDGTATESIYNADALQTEVLTKKRAKELLGDDSSDYKTYILVAGTHIVETDRPTLKNTLYIDDESKEYKEYLRGNISKVELYRDDMMSMYGSKGKIKDVEDNPATLTVDSTKDKVLSFDLYRRAEYGYRRANPDEVEIYKAAMRASHEAFSNRLDSYIRRYGKKIYVHSYWADR